MRLLNLGVQNQAVMLTASTDFILYVKTDNVGTSTSTQIALPITGTNIEVSIDGGQNYTLKGTVTYTTPTVIECTTAGSYQINIKGNLTGIYFNNVGDKLKLLEIRNWGNAIWTQLNMAFYGCENMIMTATDAPDLSQYTTSSGLYGMFWNCYVNTGGEGYANWNVSTVRTFRLIFYRNYVANPNTSGWNFAGANVVSAYRSMYEDSGLNRDITNIKTFTGLTDVSAMVHNCDLSVANYSRLLISLANQVYANAGPYSVNAGDQAGMIYNSDVHNDLTGQFNNAVDARAYLVGATALWTITGDSLQV